MSVKVFVVGTGRCGTLSVTRLFSTLPDVVAFHEPTPQLYDLTEDRLLGRDNPKLQDKLRNARQSVMENAEFYVDASHWQCWLIEDIVQLWPDAQFLWLRRDLFSWVWSAYRKGWHHAASERRRPWAGLIRPTPKGGWPADASRWTKLGYLWYAVNEHIARMLSAVPNNWLSLDTRSLDDHQEMNAVIAALGLPGQLLPETKVRVNTGDRYATVRELVAAGYGSYLDQTGILRATREDLDKTKSIKRLQIRGVPIKNWETPPMTYTVDVVKQICAGRDLLRKG